MLGMQSGGALPGTPSKIPISPRPIRIVIGLILIAAGLWAALGYLPGNEPLKEGGGLSEELYYAGYVASVALVVFGLMLALASAIYRAQREVLCRICNRQVVGWKTSFGLLCPLQKHYARVSWLAVMVTGVFWISAAGFLLVVAVLPFF